ncbi:MAG: glycoside hydrolase family 2 TIM barrel-domain containing protein [Acidobacteriaceae bacterium]|nr:glycoside hydrolase family 2 TIM barrel-domain containing protein [Acidobacteriaceae bacterium]
MDRRAFLKSGVFAGTVCATKGWASLLAEERLNSEATHRELATGWEFYRGPLDGRYQPWHSEELLTWEQVSLPHCFNAYDACDPDVPAYRGDGWYRSKVAVMNPYQDGRTLLHFEGAGQTAEVWVGGEHVTTHVGGYAEWVVDVTESCKRLKAGEALPLSIKCSNGRDVQRMPSDLSDFTLYGGVYRPVHLVYVPAVSLDAVHTNVTWEPGKDATVEVTARLYAAHPVAGELSLTARILGPGGRLVAEKNVSRAAWKGEEAIASFPLPKPELWTPQSPKLYRCQLVLRGGADETKVEHKFGVRHTRFEDHGPFFLNGERLLLKGTQRHEDGSNYAAALPAEEIRREFQMMKAMGANIVRLAHYQQRRLVLELCDELGIFVWEEVPWCRSGVGDECFKELGRGMLRDMIDQHRNHPSALIWGLGNEDDWPTELNGSDHAAIREYMTELRDLSHKLDPTRMTGYRRCDFAKDIPDVYSPSIWAGWYSGIYPEYAAALEKARPTVKHLMHVEWGADNHAGRNAEDPDPVLKHILTGKSTAEKGFDYKLTGGDARVSRDGTWTETYACDLFDWYLKTAEETNWLAGTLQWCFKDFSTPLRPENPVPRVNQKGLLLRDMTPKEGYYVFQSYWAKEPMLRVFGHNWPVRWGKVGQERMVRVYSNCSEVELFVNGVSAGKRTRDSKDFPCAGLRWSIAFREGENTVKAVTRVAGRELTDSVTFRYETRAWGKPAKVMLTRVNAATVKAELVDADGVLCLDSRAQIRFAVAGEAKLIDNVGTPDGSRAVQLQNGRAQISVKLDGAAQFSAVVAGVAPAFLLLAGGTA